MELAVVLDLKSPPSTAPWIPALHAGAEDTAVLAEVFSVDSSHSRHRTPALGEPPPPRPSSLSLAVVAP